MTNKTRKKHNCAIIAFFPIFPTYSGASEVVYSLYKSWPGNKKLFYLNNFHSNSKINSIMKLIFVPILFFKVFIYLFSKKEKIIIVEGASWIGFSLIFLVLTKIFIKNAKIIYHAHNIEYEIRKLNSSKVVILLTKYLEKLVYKFSDYPTVVSFRDQKNIKKIYDKKSFIFPNGIDLNRLKVKKKINYKNHILFVGSYLFYPNRLAIKKLLKINQKYIINKLSNYKVIIVGKGLPLEILKKNPNIIYYKYLKKSRLNKLLISSKFILAPLIKSPGTKIKIIETLIMGVPLIVSSDGMIGIKIFKKSNYPLIYNNDKDLIKKIYFLNKNYKKYVSGAKKIQMDYKNYYSMKNIIKRFIYENNI